jgi:hypothetical protein
MTYGATIVDLEIERLRTERRRHAGRMSSSQENSVRAQRPEISCANCPRLFLRNFLMGNF